MYNSNHRRFNRGSGRVPPKPYAPPQSHPPCRGDIFMEAGRLAAEYLISQGFLPPNSALNKRQNGTVRDYRVQDPERARPSSEVKISVLSRLGSAGAEVSADRRRRRSDSSVGGDFNWVKDKKRTDSWSEKSRGLGNGSETTDTAHFGGHRREGMADFSSPSSMQRGGEEISSLTEATGVSESGLLDSILPDSKEKFSGKTKELLAEAEDGKPTLEVGEASDGFYKDRMEMKTETEQFDDQTSAVEVDKQPYVEELDTKNYSMKPDGQTLSAKQDTLNYSVDLGKQSMSQEVDLVTRGSGELLVFSSFAVLPTKSCISSTPKALNIDVNQASEEDTATDPVPHKEPKRCVGEDFAGETSSVSLPNVAHNSEGLWSNNIQSAKEPRNIDTMSSMEGERCMQFSSSSEQSLSIYQPGSIWSLPGFEPTRLPLPAMSSGKNSAVQSPTPSIAETRTPIEWSSHSDNYYLETLRTDQSEPETNTSLLGQKVIQVDHGISVNLALSSNASVYDVEKQRREEKHNQFSPFKVCDLNLTEATEISDDAF
ncbi:hypothetical protein H6P81_013983 [Aristolochia fimbriata]|uniref:Uncharacterized protein n=1 Tax=Aristolochia fimbriata TaxID=158543 RepID=A0AAV7EG78_ARIFI|nr:hypothetical protein H6P81_013983 [Aristolochia fimbriata]